MTTNEENRSVSKTRKSIDGVFRQWRIVDSINEINTHKYKEPWYLVLYDNEYLSYDLKKAVYLIIKMEVEYDALIFVKKETNGKLYQCPRLFKKHVKLAKNSLLPKDRSTKMERILDGWIYTHAF